MIKLLYTFSFLLILLSCKERKGDEKPYNVRSDIRFGLKFFSIYVSKGGKAYVVKGRGSLYSEALQIESSDTSDVFEVSSVEDFYKNLNRIKSNPIIGPNRLGSPRTEIYYNQEKIYDAYKWDETFWNLFKPIMTQIPNGFNPFRVDNKPFE